MDILQYIGYVGLLLLLLCQLILLNSVQSCALGESLVCPVANGFLEKPSQHLQLDELKTWGFYFYSLLLCLPNLYRQKDP